MKVQFSAKSKKQIKYFYQTNGEVYEIKEANNLDEAKAIAFTKMAVNDILCECADDINPREDDVVGHRINIDKCIRAFALEEKLRFGENDTESGFFGGIPQTIIHNLTATYTWAEYSRSGKRFYIRPKNGVWFDAEYNVVE